MTASKESAHRPVHYLSTLAFGDEFLDRVAAVSPRVHVRQITADSATDIPDDVWERVDVLHTSSVLPDPAQAPGMGWVQLDTSGADHLRGTAIWDTDVPITTLGGVGPVAMAEYVMFSVLGLAHRLPALIETRANRTWPPPRESSRRFTPAPVRGTTMVILGYGRIGQETARLAGAFGMRVIGVARGGVVSGDGAMVTESAPAYDGRAVTGRPEAPVHRRLGATEPLSPHRTAVAAEVAVVTVVTVDRLDEVLPLADVLVVVLPRTPQTAGLLDANRIALLKPGAAVINASRGGIVDESALLAALRSDRVSGAVLDVFDAEPLPADAPWWDEPRVFMTPHVGGLTADYAAHVEEIVTGNMARFLTGQTLLNVVDRERGY